MIPCNCKLVSFIPKPLNKPLEDYIQDISRLDLIVGSSYFHVVFTVSFFVGDPVSILEDDIFRTLERFQSNPT